MIAYVYVDDIVFGSTSTDLKNDFVNTIQREFEMGMIGELIYFLGLQVKQTPSGTFISQSKFALNLVKKFG